MLIFDHKLLQTLTYCRIKLRDQTQHFKGSIQSVFRSTGYSFPHPIFPELHRSSF